MSFLENAIYEAELNGEISSNMRDELLEVYTESKINPIKKFKKIVEDIRKEKPSEFDETSQIKEFVDKNYGDIMDVAVILEKEPESLRKDEIKSAVAMCIGVIGFYITVIGGSAAGITMAPIIGACGLFLTFIYSIIKAIIVYCRTSDDEKVSNNLSKIRSSLKKIQDKKDLPESHKVKISKMIVAIDDAETEISEKLKITKESVNEIKLSIYESHASGLIDDIERDILLEKLEEAY